MALRSAQTLLAVFQRAGVLCIAATARGCIAHGLPATPDTILFSPVTTGATPCVHGVYLESWDATSIVIRNEIGGAIGLYVRAAVEHTVVM